ncbi:MAG: response regulator [Candidatus Stygibacter frigidus]|nr:response regulator [Candidatus Stygibacter frigidus]
MSEREDFQKRILAAFKIEAEEILETMTASLLGLEKAKSEEKQLELQELIYRQAHTLKGASRAVDIIEVESICQELESVFSVLKSGKIHISIGNADILHKSIDVIRKILASRIDADSSAVYDLNGVVIGLQNLLIKIKSDTIEEATDIPNNVKEEKPEDDIYEHQEPDLPVIPVKQAADEPSGKRDENETIRVSTSRLDKLLMQLEEMLAVKLSTIQMSRQLRVMINNFQRWEAGAHDVTPSVMLLRELLKSESRDELSEKGRKALQKVLKFLHWGNILAQKTERELTQMLKSWDNESATINMQIDSLLWDTKKIMMVPFSEVLELYPKAVRDLSRESGKSVKLIIRGEQIEIDRRILERLKNPLMHLLRNSIDHGIEKPPVRKRKNKDEMGVIRINLERSEKKRIRFTIEDDGAGIDLKKLKLAVQKQGVNSDQDLESEEKLIQYIYRSGVSTSDMITEISGRGLGLAIMKRSIEDLEGTITVETEKDKGTKFIIELPVSLVTFRGIIVKAGEGEYVIPTTKIDMIMLVNKEDIYTIENKSIIYYKRELVPLASLVNILEKGDGELSGEHFLVMLINDEDRQIAIRIDGIEEEQEILVKNFNPHLKRIRNVSGATILGSGKVVPILNLADLVNSVFNKMELLERKDSGDQKGNKQSRILIVEDSVTSRMLMKNILENAGYNVETAFDGIDGLDKITEYGYDIVISDVDMPRMNGFDMTASIRARENMKDIPVIMVTSLNKEEDLIRGKEVGANGYIVKSNFAQNDLVEIIEKLLKESIRN